MAMSGGADANYLTPLFHSKYFGTEICRSNFRLSQSGLQLSGP